MYVFFRLLKVILISFFKSRLGPLDKCISKIRIWPNDLDYNFHLNNGRYLTLMDIGRMDLSIRTGLLKAMIKNKWIPIVGSAKINYLREIKPFQVIELNSKLVEWDAKWFYMKQEFIVKNKVCAVAVIKAVFKESRKTVSPAAIFAELNLEIDPKRVQNLQFINMFKEPD
jgi:acyl-CoA thioesterase FadM